MTALYVLAQEFREAAAQLAELDLDQQTVFDTLDGLSGDLEAKAINVAMVARNMEATAAQIKEAELAMAARRKAMESRSEGLKRYLLCVMQETGILKIECPHFKISVKDNPPTVEVFEACMVPAEFMAPPPPPVSSPDKGAIRAAIKSGREVSGCKLIQHQRLEIK